jgi:hypothetical protein
LRAPPSRGDTARRFDGRTVSWQRSHPRTLGPEQLAPYVTETTPENQRWRDLAGRPDCAATAYGRLRPGDPSGYGYQWWSTPPAPGIHDGVFAALGAYGQFI